MAYKTLFRNSVIYGVSSSLQKLIPLFTIPIITAYLDKESMKIYDVTLVYAILVSWFVILGQDSASAAFYFDSNKLEQKKKVLSYSFFIQVASLVFFAAVFLLFKDQLADRIFSGDKVLGHYWMIALLVIPGHVCFNYSLVILRWLSKSYHYLALCLFNTVLSIASVWVLVRAMMGNIDSVLYSYIIAINLCGLIGVFMIRREIFVNPFPLQKDLLKKLVIFGLPFALSSFFNQLIPSIDRFFLLKFGHGESLGDYGLAVKLGSFISLATNSFALAFSPFALSIWNDENAEKRISRIFEVVSVAFMMLVPFILIFKDLLIDIFADSSYASAAMLLPFFFFGWVFDMFIYFSMLGIYKSKKAGLALIILFGSVLVSCALNMALIPYLGVYGGAAAFMATKFFLFIANLYFSKRYFHLRLNILLLTASLLLTGIMSYLAYQLNIFVYAALIGAIALTTLYFFRNTPELQSAWVMVNKKLGRNSNRA